MAHTLVWFRSDLRLRDNPALYHSLSQGRTTACYTRTPEQWKAHDTGDYRLAFEERCVKVLADDLAELGVPLHIITVADFAGLPAVLADFAARYQCDRIAFNAEYPLNERRRDAAVVEIFNHNGVAADVYHGSVVLPPGSVLTRAQKPFTVFTPFRKRWLEQVSLAQIEPLPLPARLSTRVAVAELEPPSTLGADLWAGGEHVALRLLDEFIEQKVERYARNRDFPALRATSSLSPYLSVGAISPQQILWRIASHNQGKLWQQASDAWTNELIWREFYRHVVAQFDHVSKGFAFKRHYDQVKWRHAPKQLAAWQQGLTGYPLVDAGMRQLNQTGWMHNRVRMIAAMFLTKHLLIDWREGERYFMQHLVDGDFASNNGGWQWSASTGTDAAPYFRIFNPITQATRFDPDGHYIRQWIPELNARGSAHCAGDYPEQIVEHRFARQRALACFARVTSDKH